MNVFRYEQVLDRAISSRRKRLGRVKQLSVQAAVVAALALAGTAVAIVAGERESILLFSLMGIIAAAFGCSIGAFLSMTRWRTEVDQFKRLREKTKDIPVALMRER